MKEAKKGKRLAVKILRQSTLSVDETTTVSPFNLQLIGGTRLPMQLRLEGMFVGESFVHV